MKTKTFKIGEYCKGGIITVEITSPKNKSMGVVKVIGKDWDYSRGSNQSGAKEWTRIEKHVGDTDGRQNIDEFLNELTTYYFADKVLQWIDSKVTFVSLGW